MIERAEQGFAEIFDAEVRVQLSPAADASIFCRRRSRWTCGPGDPAAGRVLLGARASEAPYFREDVTLLCSLAHILASVVDNHRLQRQGQEQDQRARELSLHASRSELKALRAQINPHFLFNALNAIAGLIHKDPAVADRTIEQLADVFRYALRGAESEWALLDDELEFVRAYLEVERARFGSRLSIDVRGSTTTSAVRGCRRWWSRRSSRTPSSTASRSCAGRASVEVSARRDDRDQLIVTVADTGPGFEPRNQRPVSGARRGAQETAERRYGLANVRQRPRRLFR